MALQPRSHQLALRVVAGSAIRTLGDLTGKPVSFGLRGDRSRTIGRRAFVEAGIEVQETPLDLANALDGVSTGDIAAVVVIGDRDAKKLDRLGATGLHMLRLSASDRTRPVVLGAGTAPRGRLDRGIRPLLAAAR